MFSFFNDTASTEIYTLSLHDALPISACPHACAPVGRRYPELGTCGREDRKSTRLNSSHRCISYAVFCLKKKRNEEQNVYRYVEQDQKNGLTTFGQVNQQHRQKHRDKR